MMLLASHASRAARGRAVREPHACLTDVLDRCPHALHSLPVQGRARTAHGLKMGARSSAHSTAVYNARRDKNLITHGDKYYWRNGRGVLFNDTRLHV